MDKILLRDLSKYKFSIEERLSDHHQQQQQQQHSSTNVNNSNQSSLPQNQNSNLNPPLPPRGQIFQSYQHKQSLSNFQPRSLYAQKDFVQSNSPNDTHLPSQQQQQQNNRSSTSAHEQTFQYKNQNYTRNPIEQIHSQTEQDFKQQSQYSTQANKLEIKSFSHTNSQQTRSSLDRNSSRMNTDSIPSHFSSNPTSNYIPMSAGFMSKQYLPNKYSQNPHSTNSSQHPCVNSVSSQCNTINGYRPSMDFSSQQNDAQKTAYSNRIDSVDFSETYQGNAALKRNTKPVSGGSPYSFKQVRIFIYLNLRNFGNFDIFFLHRCIR